MSELVYGIAQLEVYNIAKKHCSKDFDIFILCQQIKELEQSLEEFENKWLGEDKVCEEHKQIIRSVGEYLGSEGGYELMYAVCCLLEIKNHHFSIILDKVWSGIKDQNGNICWLA